jgi:hypothetical protein
MLSFPGRSDYLDRTLVAKPSDTLQNSSLSIGRARRLMDADQWVYKGPVYYQ